jgi:DNA-binding transcriptional MerR regulator
MVYTVKQLADLSGVSVRTLHFYDEVGLLKPASHAANGYRYYGDEQLLMLQQILFYRELGFELKQIKQILGRADFEKLAALVSHRDALAEKLQRTASLLATIDKTIQHLKGETTMETSEIFGGFRVGAREDRFGERVELGGFPVDCKLSAQDTDGSMCVVEMTSGWPRHLHREQDEWIYVVEGAWVFEVGGQRFHLGPGESLYIPRNTAHVGSQAGEGPSRILNLYRPAGRIEEFLRAIANIQQELPTKEDVVQGNYTEQQKLTLHQLFDRYGMDLLGPPLVSE